jgi:hypothetical protein
MLRKVWRILVVVLVMAAGGLAPAEAVELPLFPPATGAWLMEGTRTNPPRYYGPTAPSAEWHIAQFQNPGPNLSPFRSIELPTGAIEYIADARDAAVTLQPTNQRLIVTLSQNGSNLPCTRRDSLAGAREFDLFFGMNGRGTGNGIPIPRPAHLAAGGSLSHMRALHHIVRMKILAAKQPRTQNDCEVNAAGLLSSLVFKNDIAKPHQVLFYRIDLARLCFSGPRRAACERNRTRGLFYRRGRKILDRDGTVVGRSFGYRDTLASYNLQMASPQVPLSVDIDVLPRLKEFISHGEYGMDPDWRHWRIVSAYFGQNIWGNAAVTSQWSDFRYLVDMQ